MGGGHRGGGGGGSSAPAYTPPPPPVINAQMSGATGGQMTPIMYEAPQQQQGMQMVTPTGYVPSNIAGPAATTADPQEMGKAAKNPYAAQSSRPRAAVAAANQRVSGMNNYQAPSINGITFGGN